ncbi:MAG TPA: RluA family pseudouridine synthase [Rhabdochlamydiaceae bacterium]|nr:RluA family pseudouridine synthase [Rhabdochlamydiaceae bacterium]
MNILRFTVSSSNHGMRLLAFLREHISEANSVKSLKRAIEAGSCSINGRIERFSSKILAAGDVVELTLSDEKTRPCCITVLYEDADLIICDKPAGIVSENSEFNRHLPSYRGELQLVHRLDKDTSGIIVAAKNNKTKEKLVDLFAKRKVHKTYLALVDGVVKKKEGKIDNFLAKKSSYQGQSIWGSVPKGKGVIALTKWRCLKRGKSASLLLCEPQTGRTHQLRVHLSEMHHPILGDYQYCQKFLCTYRPQRQLLHAFKIQFCHPFTKELITIEAPLPSDFKHALKILGLPDKF